MCAMNGFDVLRYGDRKRGGGTVLNDCASSLLPDVVFEEEGDTVKEGMDPCWVLKGKDGCIAEEGVTNLFYPR
jgi:hypothetical protein